MRYNDSKMIIPKILVKEKLAESAFHEFSKRGYFSTNPDTITRHVNVNRAVFYTYFKNKNEILMYLVEEMLGDLSGLLQDENAHKLWMSKNNLADFEEPFRYLADLFICNSGVVRAFMHGMVVDKELMIQFDLICQRFSGIFKKKIDLLQKAGRFQGCNAQIMAKVMAVILLVSIFFWVTGIIECSVGELTQNIALLFFSVIKFDEKEIKISNSNIPNSEKSRKTRRLIMQAAKIAFDKYGYRKTSMVKIAQEAGFTRATIYLYYKNKQELIDALKRESFDITEPVSDLYDFDIGMEKEPANPSRGSSQKARKQDITRQKILAEAKKLFAEKGYFGTTLEAISKKTGYSRSTIYIHFQKKDNIICALLEDMLNEIDPSNLSTLFKDVDATSIDDMVRVNNLAIDIFQNDPSVPWTWLQGVFYSPELAEHFKNLYQQFTSPIREMISTSKKKGKCKKVNAQTASNIILTGLCYTIALYTSGFIKCSKNELSLTLAKLLFGFYNF